MRIKRPSYLITGPSKAGKSTLCMDILHYLKNNNEDVGGVITVQNLIRWMYLIQDDRKIRFEAKSGEEFIRVGKFNIHKGTMKQAINQIQKNLKNGFQKSAFLDIFSAESKKLVLESLNK